ALPVGENRTRAGAPGIVKVTLDHALQPGRIVAGHVGQVDPGRHRRRVAPLAGDRLELDLLPVAAGCELPVRVPHISDAAAHAGGEVDAGRTEHRDDTAGHVFAAVIAASLDHRNGAGVAHREALAGDAAEIGLAI